MPENSLVKEFSSYTIEKLNTAYLDKTILTDLKGTIRNKNMK
jgi:hypothetical protein